MPVPIAVEAGSGGHAADDDGTPAWRTVAVLAGALLISTGVTALLTRRRFPS